MSTDRKTPPELSLLSLPTLQNPQSLGKGIYTFFKENTAVFRLDIVFPNAGSGNAIAPKSSVLCSEMLLSGTKKQNAQQVNAQLDFFGSYVSITTSYYKTLFTVYGLTKYFDKIIQLVSDAINNSVFPQEELEIIKQQKIANLKIQQQKTSYQSKVLQNKFWFGKNSILGKESAEKDYSDISRETLLQEYQQNFGQLFMVLCSGSELKEKTSLLHELFADKLVENTDFKAEKIVFSKTLPQEKTACFPVPAANQSSFCARLEVPSRQSEDYATLSLLNLILGGYFGSRLMKNIREEKGWTYGVFSQIKNYSDKAFIEIAGDIRADKAVEVKAEIKREFEKLKTERINNGELETAKNYYLGNLQSAFDNFLLLGERHITLLESGKTLEWYNKFGETLRTVTSQNILTASQNYLDFNSLVFTWSGPNP